MCKKCMTLKNIWWEKKKLSLHLLSNHSDLYHIIAYEVSSSWKALFNQKNKHVRYWKLL